MANQAVENSPQRYARVAGFTCLVNGHLIFRSGYLPKFVGILLQVAGLSYLLACFSALFAPAFADLIIPAILLPPLIGESSFCLWLLVKGVDGAKWKERMSTMYPHTPISI
jgi:Domain of unknown function (DUF4386)